MPSPVGSAGRKFSGMPVVGFILLIPLLVLFNTIANLFLLRRPRNLEMNFSPSVAVLVPLRNETSNVKLLIESLRAQRGIENLQVHLIDDNSTDNTYQSAKESILGDKIFELHQGKSLPKDWLGKSFALQQGLEFSDSEYVVVIDADVRLVPGAISSALTLLSHQNLDFASSYPQEIAISWAERLVQPLLQWSWLATVPLRIAERSTNSALAVANGQFFLVRRAAIDKIGGFESVKRKVLDDIELARILLRAGFHGTVFEGSRIAQCRMYTSWNEIREGYSKSLYTAFGGVFGMCVAIVFLFVTGVLPLLLGLFGFKIAWIALVAMIISRFLASSATRGKLFDGVLHPLSSLILIHLILRSWRMRGMTQWKGRVI